MCYAPLASVLSIVHAERLSILLVPMKCAGDSRLTCGLGQTVSRHARHSQMRWCSHERPVCELRVLLVVETKGESQDSVGAWLDELDLHLAYVTIRSLHGKYCRRTVRHRIRCQILRADPRLHSARRGSEASEYLSPQLFEVFVNFDRHRWRQCGDEHTEEKDAMHGR